MDEKQKRLRTHVVKEIVETERVYCEQIRFVTEVGGRYVTRAGRVAHTVGVVGSLAADRGWAQTLGRTEYGSHGARVCAGTHGSACACGEPAVRLAGAADGLQASIVEGCDIKTAGRKCIPYHPSRLQACGVRPLRSIVVLYRCTCKRQLVGWVFCDAVFVSVRVGVPPCGATRLGKRPLMYRATPADILSMKLERCDSWCVVYDRDNEKHRRYSLDPCSRCIV